MPYAFETHKLKLPVGTDRRVKLTSIQKEEIKELFNSGVAQREIARDFKVSRRLIYWITHPEKYEEFREVRRGCWKHYYNKESRNISMQEHRQYKANIFKNLNTHI